MFVADESTIQRLRFIKQGLLELDQNTILTSSHVAREKHIADLIEYTIAVERDLIEQEKKKEQKPGRQKGSAAATNLDGDSSSNVDD